MCRLDEIRESLGEEFVDWFKEAKELAHRIETDITIPCMIGRQKYRANIQSASPEEYYSKNVVIPFLDHLMQQMDTRFDNKDRVGSSLFSLIRINIMKMKPDIKPLTVKTSSQTLYSFFELAAHFQLEARRKNTLSVHSGE